MTRACQKGADSTVEAATMRFRCVPTSVHPYRREGMPLTFFAEASLSVHDTGMPEGGGLNGGGCNHVLQVRTYICTSVQT